MNYGKAVRVVRSTKRLSQKALAEAADLDPSYISLIENGQREPSLTVLEQIAEPLAVPLYLLVLIASEEKDLRGVSEEHAQLLGKSLLELLK